MEEWRANWIERRIARAATASTIVVGALRRTVFGNRELSSEAKMTVYNAVHVVVPTLVYGMGAKRQG